MSKRKILAITIGPEEKTYSLNRAYTEYIDKAGFEPLVLTPQNDPLVAAELADGLVLPGGKDIDPIHYGEFNLASLDCDPEKDNFERSVFRAFADAGKKVFGICRGAQLIAREFIYAHENAWAAQEKTKEILVFLQDIPYHSQTSRLSLKRKVRSHFVECRESILYGRGDNIGYISVNSMHHQYIHANLASHKVPKLNVVDGFQMLAWTAYGIAKDVDGWVCEAFQIMNWPNEGNLLRAVQWHPEELMDVELLRNFFLPKTKKVTDGNKVAR